MEEDVDFDVVMDEYHDKTIEAVDKHLSDKINLVISDNRILLYIYDKQITKGLLFKKKKIVKLAKICIAFLPKYQNTITVYEDGKPYYEIFKKIGEEVGYDSILRKWR